MITSTQDKAFNAKVQNKYVHTYVMYLFVLYVHKMNQPTI